MAYTCQNCGVAADNYSDLCNPTSEELNSNFCDIPAAHVCYGQLSSMKYTCDLCGSVSADAEHLCNPSEIK